MTRHMSNIKPDTHIELSNGDLFDPLNPSGVVPLDVIVRSLSNMCRFAGQIDSFYSNGQHSVLVAGLSSPDIETQKIALLHDADECFGLPDMVSQLKVFFPDFVLAQKNIGKAIFEMYGLDPKDGARVKPADRLALAIERRHLKSQVNSQHWAEWEQGIEDIPNIALIPLPPKDAHRLTSRAFRRVFAQGEPITLDWMVKTQGFRVKRQDPKQAPASLYCSSAAMP